MLVVRVDRATDPIANADRHTLGFASGIAKSIDQRILC